MISNPRVCRVVVALWSFDFALCSPEKFSTDSFVSLNSKLCGESFFEERITFECKRIPKPKYGLRTELLVSDQVSTHFGRKVGNGHHSFCPGYFYVFFLNNDGHPESSSRIFSPRRSS